MAVSDFTEHKEHPQQITTNQLNNMETPTTENKTEQPAVGGCYESACSIPSFTEMNEKWKADGGYYVGKNNGVYRGEALEVSVCDTDYTRIDETRRDGESWLAMRERTKVLRVRAEETQKMRAETIAAALNQVFEANAEDHAPTTNKI